MEDQIESVTPAPESQVEESAQPAVSNEPEAAASQSQPEPAKEEKKPETLKERFARLAKESSEKKAEKPEEKPTKEGETPAPEPKKDEPAGAAKPTQTAYKPDYKFRFTDEKQQKQEKEFPDWAKAAIKDAESEKEIRSLFEKAHGMDFLKAQSQQRAQQNQTLQAQNFQYQTGIEKLRKFYSEGNMEGIFNLLQISEEKVLQYALERAKYYELPPDQRGVIDAQKKAQTEAELASQRAAAVEQQYLSQQQQTKQLQLNLAFMKPEVASVAEEFDKRVGKQGAFFEQVINHGEATWYRSQGKTDLPPEEAIQQVMAMYGLSAPAAQAPTSAAQPAAPAPAAPAPTAPAAQPAAAPVQNSPAVKVIPNISGRASSATSGQKAPRSVEDLKKMRKERYGA
jgi:hypothetical protein